MHQFRSGLILAEVEVFYFRLEPLSLDQLSEHRGQLVGLWEQQTAASFVANLLNLIAAKQAL